MTDSRKEWIRQVVEGAFEGFASLLGFHDTEVMLAARFLLKKHTTLDLLRCVSAAAGTEDMEIGLHEDGRLSLTLWYRK